MFRKNRRTVPILWPLTQSPLPHKTKFIVESQIEKEHWIASSCYQLLYASRRLQLLDSADAQRILKQFRLHFSFLSKLVIAIASLIASCRRNNSKIDEGIVLTVWTLICFILFYNIAVYTIALKRSIQHEKDVIYLLQTVEVAFKKCRLFTTTTGYLRHFTRSMRFAIAWTHGGLRYNAETVTQIWYRNMIHHRQYWFALCCTDLFFDSGITKGKIENVWLDQFSWLMKTSST